MGAPASSVGSDFPSPPGGDPSHEFPGRIPGRVWYWHPHPVQLAFRPPCYNHSCAPVSRDAFRGSTRGPTLPFLSSRLALGPGICMWKPFCWF